MDNKIYHLFEYGFSCKKLLKSLEATMVNVYIYPTQRVKSCVPRKTTSSFYTQDYTHDRNLSGGGLMLQMNGKILFQVLTGHPNDSNLEIIA